MQLLQAVADDFVAQVPFQLDNKAVVAKTKPGRTRLDLGEVQVSGGELPEDLVQVAGAVCLLEADQARTVMARGRGQHPPCHEDKTGLVTRVVLDPPHNGGKTVQAPGYRGCDRGSPVRLGLTDEPRCLGRRGRVHDLRPVQILMQEPTALGERDRDRDHPADLAEICAGGREEVQVNVQHVLHLDEKVRVKDEVVEGSADRAVDRVLYGDKGGIDLAPVGGVERVGDRRHRHRLGFGQERDRQKGLLAEGALGTEKSDPLPTLHRFVHEGRIVIPMDELEIRRLIDDLRSGACSPDDAVRKLRRLPFTELGFAKVDHHRSLRQGLPEAVYGPGKTPAQCAAIVAELLVADGGGPVLLTRADQGQVTASLATSPGGQRTPSEPEAGRLSTVVWRQQPDRPGRVLVLTAGTGDLPVAEECIAVLGGFGFHPGLLGDCGVAGVHRLFASMEEVTTSDVVIVVAGMEGALPSLVAGLTPAPVIAVPTSVGYGASLEGVTALLAMLASCAAGITVVGIDNGFGAACAAARLLR